MKNVEIVYSFEEAIEKNLEIDHDDSHCYNKEVKKFALLIHGTQPIGTDASKAVQKLRSEGTMGYKRGIIEAGRKVA